MMKILTNIKYKSVNPRQNIHNNLLLACANKNDKYIDTEEVEKVKYSYP